MDPLHRGLGRRVVLEDWVVDLPSLSKVPATAARGVWPPSWASWCQVVLLMAVWLAVGNVRATASSTAAWTPPPEPSVRPLIAEQYPEDRDHDRISDRLQSQAATLESAAAAAVTLEARNSATNQLAQFVDVELVFDRQITQSQINAFQRLGGEITYLYRSVSYGWNGRVPLDQIGKLPSAMGSALVLVTQPVQAQWHLSLATQTGRVRPVWAAGFAGSSMGYSGNTNITIAIVDTGVDESHTDLNGRRVYWHDFTTDSNSSPVDIVAHGSHVAGIALGTGDAAGTNGPLLMTQSGSLSNVTGFFPAPVDLPAISVDFRMMAQWVGGGSTTFYLVSHSKGTLGGWGYHSLVPGATPLSLNTTLTGYPNLVYSPALYGTGTNEVEDFVVTCQVTNYGGVGDGFNTLRGVAPGCNWAGAKVFNNDGNGDSSAIDAGIDDLVANRLADHIKVMNMSLGYKGSPGLDSTTRQKVNTAVNNGIVVVISAGNDGNNSTPSQREIDDPGRAAMALTVAAANDVNQLTYYTSEGFSSPTSVSGQEEDYKPDLMAPGGSTPYYTGILSVDSNDGDGTAFADQQTNDYQVLQGTSMASPFVAGCAALVIEALEEQGTNWDFNSSQDARFVKMVLCATASESNTNRESNSNNPTLQRAATGPDGFPASKDPFEGYGMINPDAAIEAVSTTLSGIVSQTLGAGPTDRRVWATQVTLSSGEAFQPQMTVPVTGDFDMYLYSTTPSPYGTPAILASSTDPGDGVSENLSYTPSSNTTALLVVKRVSGSGTFDLVAPLNLAGTVTYYPTNYPPSNPSSVTVSGVTLDVSGDSSTNVLTASDGTYGFTNIPFGGSYCVSPAKTDDSPAARGVTSLDIALIRRDILKLETFDSPYKRLAADVNGSGSVNSLDIALIRRVILALDTSFPSGLWRFVPADFDFSDPLNPWDAPTDRCYSGLSSDSIGEDYVAIKLGDVNSSWTSPNASPSAILASVHSQGQSVGAEQLLPATVTLWTGNYLAEPGTTTTVALYAKGLRHLTSIQASLQWDSSVLHYTGVEGFGLRGMNLGNFNTVASDTGRLTFAWDDPQAVGTTMAGNVPLFSVRFAVVGSPGRVSRVSLTDSPTVCEVGLNFASASLVTRDGQVTVVTQPKLNLIEVSKSAVTLAMPTQLGRTYILESTDFLPTTNWIEQATINGNGDTKIFSDHAPRGLQRYYRVRVE